MTKRSLVPMVFGRGFEPFKEISRDLERLEGSFNDLWRGTSLLPWVKEQPMIPNIDVIENDREIQVVADLPGLNEKDIHIDVEDGIFSLRGEKREEREENRKGYHVSERSSGSFYRTFQLPTVVDEDKIEATLKDGVLTVLLPKSADAEKQRKRIEIKRQ